MRQEDELDPVSRRQLAIVRGITAKALEALRSMPLTSAVEAVRALEISLRVERLLLDIPAEPKPTSFEQLIGHQFDTHSRAISQEPKE